MKILPTDHSQHTSTTGSTRRRKRLLVLSVIFIMLAGFISCGSRDNHAGDIEIQRFEKILFDTPADQLQSQLHIFATGFTSPLLPIYPDQKEYMAQLTQFIADPTVRDIYDITCQQYPDLHWLEKEITAALDKAMELDDEINFNLFATYISGLSDYDQRIAADRESGSVRISLDHYAIGAMGKYSYFGMPMYIVERCDSAHLASDIMAAITRQFVAMPDEKDVTMLDIMVSEGKVLYFLDQVMPRKADNIKIRYTEEQLEWMRRNESNVWAYFIQNNLLYEKDFSRYHNFVDEAPKTNAFKDSAPRTTHYVGWQIVRQYMNNTKSSIKDLFANTNSQQILQQSGYKP